MNRLDAIQALFSAILATSRSFVEGYDLFKTIKKSTVSKRVSVSLPDLTHEKLQRWADIEGTSLADLAAYLLRRDVEQAEKEGKLNYPNEKK
ncbi:ribbon-helix-helix domain-containing protein [Nostoc sp.]|uniref:ribbon-helix-helix domain-containing protein n=1 Tax=Nostoc sp. TaxID=1180 RepID=UPI002FF6404A